METDIKKIDEQIKTNLRRTFFVLLVGLIQGISFLIFDYRQGLGISYLSIFIIVFCAIQFFYLYKRVKIFTAIKIFEALNERA